MANRREDRFDQARDLSAVLVQPLVVQWVWEQIDQNGGWGFAEYDGAVVIHEHLELDRLVLVHVVVFGAALLLEKLLPLKGLDWLVMGIRPVRSGMTCAWVDSAAGQASVVSLSIPCHVLEIAKLGEPVVVVADTWVANGPLKLAAVVDEWTEALAVAFAAYRMGSVLDFAAVALGLDWAFVVVLS